jgi:DNA end-binding protein Ku
MPCCTRRSGSRAAPASATGSSTTASAPSSSDDLVDPADFELGRVQRKPTDREIKMASALVEGLHTKFDPADYEDAYREAVLEVVERKAAGKNIEPPEDVETESADDLLAALEASLA